MTMDRTIKLKLGLSNEEKDILKSTMNISNQVFNEVAEYGFCNKTHNKIKVHHATYYHIREKYPELPCAIVQGVRDVACEALKSVKLKTLPQNKEYASIRYNKRVCNVKLVNETVSIASIHGRIKTTFKIPVYYEKYLEWELRTSTLRYKKQQDTFYLHVTIRKQPPKPTGDRVLGIDRGIVNIAVTSNNKFFNGKQVKNTRAKYAHLRAELQSKGTRSARRLLKKISGKENRFITHVNHCISKEIVDMPYDVFAIEDLTSIRVQNRNKGKQFTRKLNNWSFYQLQQFLEYKAEAASKSVMTVDPRYTSQKCSECGHIYKGNRKGHSFKCVKCGFQIHSDLNAARNIADIAICNFGRLSVNQPYATCDEVESQKGIEIEHSCNAPCTCTG